MRALVITNTITQRDEQSLESYLKDVSKYEVLSPEEEMELFRRIRSGDEVALTKIVLHNLRFVISVAKQYQNLGLRLNDLINEGNIGLIKAAQRFDETKGFKFISYAVWWVRQSILQAINDKGRKIRLPLNVSGLASKVVAKRIEFLQQFEREPSARELAEALDVPVKKVKDALANFKGVTSLDAPLNEEEDGSLSSVLRDDSIEEPDYALSIRESQQLEVKELLSSLPERQALIVSMYFGIGLREAATLEEIGDRLGISRERVRQLKDKALRKLQMRNRDMLPTFS